MKATSIIRRIDDLGRIVIPKEIRRNPQKSPFARGRPDRVVCGKEYGDFSQV